MGTSFSRLKSLVSTAIAFFFTAAVTVFNLLYVILMLQKGYGTQLISLLAVAFGVYLAIQQWTTMKSLK